MRVDQPREQCLSTTVDRNGSRRCRQVGAELGDTARFDKHIPRVEHSRPVKDANTAKDRGGALSDEWVCYKGDGEDKHRNE
jgi:hypothetical protein